MSSTITFNSFPRTESPPDFVSSIVSVFRENEIAIATLNGGRHLKSDEVLGIVRGGLERLGFDVERGKASDHKIHRPVFFGENGVPTLRFEVDAYHAEWQCGIEVEATRAIRGGAFYRDLIQALVMTKVSHLCVAIPNYIAWGKQTKSQPAREAVRTAEALFGHSRIRLPFGLTIIGY